MKIKNREKQGGYLFLLIFIFFQLRAEADPLSSSPAASEKYLEDFMNSQSNQDFKGKSVTLQLKDAEVEDVFRLIGEASGFNVVLGPEVKGKISLSLVDVPWDQALSVVLQTLHLGADRNQNVLRVMSLENFSKEKEAALRLEKVTQAGAPRVTRVFTINHADPKELQGIITSFLSQTKKKEGDDFIQSDSLVQYDPRTNSLIVRDLPVSVARIAKLIETLDVPPSQVMIEAKVIEASESFSRTLNGSLGVGSQSNWVSLAGGNPLDQLVGSPGVFSSGVTIAGMTGSSGNLSGMVGLSPQISFFPGSFRLNALLSWGETESLAKVVSSPKLVVMNREKATILQGTPLLVPGTTTVAGVGGEVPTSSVQSANVSLVVKPTVSQQGSVLLDLFVSKDVPVAFNSSQFGVGSRNMNTLVLVESGSTLAIGGIYSVDNTQISTGIPFLRKWPLIGAFFGSEQNVTKRTELLIFITPRILEQKNVLPSHSV